MSEEAMELREEPLQLGEWVDPAPLIVQPQMDLEVVADMFKRLGPRVVLACRSGQLVGIVTIKDLLRHMALHEQSYVSFDAASGAEFSVGQGELSDLLEAVWLWVCGLCSRTPWLRRFVAAESISTESVPLSEVSTTLYENES